MRRSDSEGSERRRLPRYLPHPGIQITCFEGEEIICDDTSEEFVLGVADISLEGICLAVSKPLEVGQRLALLMTFSLHQSMVTMVGTVMWYEEEQGEMWAGVKFDAPLSWLTLKCLAEAKLLGR